jgi:hypothetical protein
MYRRLEQESDKRARKGAAGCPFAEFFAATLLSSA